MKEQITIPKNVNYLSEVMTELPKNCLFDKGKVGCGGTTIALTSKENYIICVPFVSLIRNKVSQSDKYPNVFGFYSGVSVTDLKMHIMKKGPKKIMVTYDSLEKLMTYIDPSKYNILIDEYHLLFTQYSFRREAVQKVLPNYDKFKSFCFMTATVVDSDFVLDELAHIPIVEAKWENVREVTVNSVKCKTDVRGTVQRLINNHLKGLEGFEGNAYIFVNSVKFIKGIIGSCGLNEDNCRVIYSTNNKTDVGISNSSTFSHPKKINLLTSTVFEGSDLYDEDGQIYIVSDSTQQQTLTDISTSFQQIAGRIRNTKYWSTITHIFTTTRYYNDLSYQEFKESVEKVINEGKDLVKWINNAPDKFRDKLLTEQKEEGIYCVKGSDNMFFFDSNMVKIDLYNFKICKSLYKLRVNVVEELENHNYIVKTYDSDRPAFVVETERPKNFQETIEEIENLEPGEDLYVEALAKYDFLEEAISKIGFEGIKKLNYVQTNIKRILIKEADTSEIYKIFKTLRVTNLFNNGAFIPSAKAKSIINNTIAELGITRTLKITDLFEVKESVKKQDGKSVKGYIIILPKVIIK